MFRFFYCALLILFIPLGMQAQKPTTQFNGFGHMEYSLDYTDHADSYFSIGEHDFFLSSKLNDRISFLGEFVVRYNSGSATTFLPSIERGFVKFNYKNNRNLIFGKVHSPVNYWNDVYHHGRLFFPVIDRPNSFSYLVPLHTLGVQLQGQNLGKHKFGYDLVLGNGISSSDVFNDNLDMSITAAFHFKPKEGMRIGASYYYDFLENNISGVHSGHASPRAHYNGPLYKGSVRYHLVSASFANFNDSWEVLNEFAYNATHTDSLGLANNFSNYLYIGKRIQEKQVPYVLWDFMHIAHNDLHTYELQTNKIALGYKYEFSPFINVKAQIERFTDGNHPTTQVHRDRTSFRLQLAYGF